MTKICESKASPTSPAESSTARITVAPSPHGVLAQRNPPPFDRAAAWTTLAVRGAQGERRIPVAAAGDVLGSVPVARCHIPRKGVRAIRARFEVVAGRVQRPLEDVARQIELTPEAHSQGRRAHWRDNLRGRRFAVASRVARPRAGMAGSSIRRSRTRWLSPGPSSPRDIHAAGAACRGVFPLRLAR